MTDCIKNTLLDAAYRRLTSELKTHTYTSSKRMEKHFSANGNDRKAERAIFTSDKIDFKLKAIAKGTTLLINSTPIKINLRNLVMNQVLQYKIASL